MTNDKTPVTNSTNAANKLNNRMMEEKKFEELGTLKEFCEKYGDCTFSFESIHDYNIILTISSNQEIEFKILCSNALSDIIRKDNGLPENLLEYHVLQ